MKLWAQIDPVVGAPLTPNKQTNSGSPDDWQYQKSCSSLLDPGSDVGFSCLLLMASQLSGVHCGPKTTSSMVLTARQRSIGGLVCRPARRLLL